MTAPVDALTAARPLRAESRFTTVNAPPRKTVEPEIAIAWTSPSVSATNGPIAAVAASIAAACNAACRR